MFYFLTHLFFTLVPYFLQTVSFFVDVDRGGAMYCVLYCSDGRLLFFFVFFFFDQLSVFTPFRLERTTLPVNSASDI